MTDETVAIDELPEAPEVDPEAPHGRRADGTPRRRPGPPKGSGGRPPKGSGPTAPPRRRPTKRPASSVPDYRPGILGALQLVSVPLAVAGRSRPELALDAAAVAVHAPGIADALQQIAQERPEVAAALERVLSVGPYGALIGALLPLLAQIGANHGKIPPALAESVGAMSRESFERSLIGASGDAS